MELVDLDFLVLFTWAGAADGDAADAAPGDAAADGGVDGAADGDAADAADGDAADDGGDDGAADGDGHADAVILDADNKPRRRSRKYRGLTLGHIDNNDFYTANIANFRDTTSANTLTTTVFYFFFNTSDG